MSELIQTRGIVLHRVKYSDSSLIIKVYTEKLGLRSYLVRSARGKRSKQSIALFAPLSLLDLVVYERSNKDLQHIREVRLERSYTHIPFSEKRQSVFLFLNEMIYRSIREEESNPLLFSFLHEKLIELDSEGSTDPDFHLHFLISFSRLLGFGPENNYGTGHECFSLREGSFKSRHLLDDTLLDEELSTAFSSIINLQPDTGITNLQRRKLLLAMLDYYRYHLEGMGEVRSFKVLEKVFHS